MTKTPPHNEEAEQALLGALLVNNKAYGKVGEFLRPEHFYDPAHQRLYGAIAELIEAGRVASPVTLRAHFDQVPELASSGGGAYLAELAANVVTVVNAGDYGRTIHDLFLCRQIIEIAAGMNDAAYAADIASDPAGIIARGEADLAMLQDLGRVDGGGATLDQVIADAWEAIQRAQACPDGVSGVPSGLKDLDRMTGGFQPADLIIIAGRPSMGKTVIATTASVNAALRGYVPLFNSLEMGTASLGLRLLATRSDVPVNELRRPLSPSQIAAVQEAKQYYAGLPLTVDTDSGLTVAQIRARARAHKRRHGLSMLVVDYLGLINAEDRRANKVHQIEENTKALKALAKELDVPVILLCQLSREVEKREDKRPQLSDLRDSGAIEQDADVVMFVYREHYYLTRSDPARRPGEAQDKFNDRYAEWQAREEATRNISEVIIAKNRQGEIGTVRLRFDGRRQVFEDLHDGERGA